MEKENDFKFKFELKGGDSPGLCSEVSGSDRDIMTALIMGCNKNSSLFGVLDSAHKMSKLIEIKPNDLKDYDPCSFVCSNDSDGMLIETDGNIKGIILTLSFLISRRVNIKNIVEAVIAFKDDKDDNLKEMENIINEYNSANHAN